VLSLGTGILFGLSPALQSTRPDLAAALKDEGTSFGQRLSRSRLRSLLLAGQVAVSMVLVISAGLLTRGLLRSQSADTGFETKHLLLFFGAFGEDSKNDARQRLLLNRLQTLPQLRSAAIGGFPMMGTWTPPMIAGGVRGRTLASYASETYFDTLGVALLRGRGFQKQETDRAPRAVGAGSRFTRQDIESAERVAVISESTARRFWPAEDPIGQRFQLDMDFRGTLAEFEVIGIARDIRYANLTRIDPAHVYLAGYAAGSNGILLRVQGDPRSALAAVRKVVEELDKDLLMSLNLMSVEEGPLRLQKSLARAYGMFAVILAFLALALAGIGIYGVMAYLVSQRVREIGIRMALGATKGGVLKAVVLGGLRPVLAGIGVGLAGAAGLSSVLHATLVFPGSTDLLYGVPFYDPATFLGLSCFLAGVAAVASLVPARRALRVDPMTALRHE
jgi:putative ABC transport system permease protein